MKRDTGDDVVSNMIECQIVHGPLTQLSPAHFIPSSEKRVKKIKEIPKNLIYIFFFFYS